MTGQRQSYLDQLVTLLDDFIQDWDCDLEGSIGPETLLFADLEFESIDIIQLVVAIQEEVIRQKLSFDDLLMKDGRYVDDLSVGAIAQFLTERVGHHG